MQRLFTRDRLFVLAILVPLFILVALLIYYPAVDTFGTSLTSRNLRTNRSAFVGFENYLRLFEDEEFWDVTKRSLSLVMVVLPLELVVALLAALLLNERFPGRGIVRALVVLPWMVPPVVNGFLWGWLLNGEYGAFNGLLYQFGLISEYQSWLREPLSQILWVAVVHVWTRFAFPTIVLLAGLQGIQPDLYAAARVDGAGPFQSFMRITFPLLLPSFAISLVIEFIAAFQIFDVIWTLTAGGSAGGTINPFTKTLMIFNYELVFRDLRIGLGAALSYIILLISAGFGFFFIWRLYNQTITAKES